MGIELTPRARGIVGVRADSGNATRILAELQKTFEDFKAEREKEIADLKKGMKDVVQTEKVDRINAEITKLQGELDRVNASLAALKVGGEGEAKALSAEKREHARVFNQFFRKGVENGLRELEAKAALRTDSDPDGGYVVPEEMESTIDRVLGTVSAMRSISRVISISPGPTRSWSTRAVLLAVGSASMMRVLRRQRRSSLRWNFRRWNFTPTPPPRRHCWTIPASASSSGWPMRCRSPLPSWKVLPSSPAPA